MSYNDIRTTEPPFPTPVSQDDYDALAARLAATEENLERETALLTEARQQNADLMAIIDKRDEALGFIPLDKGMDMQDELRETKARLAEAVAAVQAFADHFGPLEDNHMLNDECRHCFALARGVLGTADSAPAVTDNCPLCGEPRADHAEIAPNGKPECRMKCKRCGDTGWLQGDPILGISDEPCGCDENWEE